MKRFLLVLVLVLAVSAFTPVLAANGNIGTIVRIAGDVVVEKDEVVQGDVVVIFGNVRVEGTVYGNVVTILGNTTIASSGSVLGDVVTILGTLSTGHGSRITGSKVNILGEQDALQLPVFFRRLPAGILKFSWILKGVNLVSGILLALLIFALFPVPVERVRRSIEHKPGRMALLGLLVYLAGIPLILLTFITIIGIPVALLMSVLLWAANRLGQAALVLIIGRSLFKGAGSDLAALALGALLLGIAAGLPWVGSLVNLVASLIAVGGAFTTRMGTREEKTA
ncbi:MAG: hypothetical protein GX090_02740 [Firmicutes bacterium]|nr:hypothetical protein [Bacillota bacterium]HOB34307.1 hypothetical protein [Bacillota bacterium]HPZ90686.1 hypothetical protein [Bacillota bacterium]HQE01518.1 hypothetical protein [Bacillota bacterium]